MKMNQIVFPLALALAATLATTGCKHTPVKITQIPGPQARNPNDGNNPGTIPAAPPFNPNDSSINGADKTGGGPLAGRDEFENMIKDPAALAANTIHFAFDSAAIKKSEQSNLETVAAALKSSASDKLLIEGNCDERGTDEYNRALGEKRALAAREALAKLGVSADRVRTLSNGKDKPADTSHEESAWAKNRRDEFILLHPKAGV